MVSTSLFTSTSKQLSTCTGEALYRFLIARSARVPFCRLHCRGTHTENKSRWVTDHGSNGHSQSRFETYTETVTDFDFCIDIKPGQELDPQPTHWSVADDEPAYRGLMVREVEMPLAAGKRTATRKEIKEYKAFVAQRKAHGLPPWVADLNIVWTEGVSEQDHVLKSSKSLRQWADEYCASPKYLKEFVYDQVSSRLQSRHYRVLDPTKGALRLEHAATRRRHSFEYRVYSLQWIPPSRLYHAPLKDLHSSRQQTV